MAGHALSSVPCRNFAHCVEENNSSDPVTLLPATLLRTADLAGACLSPALCASHTDPMAALRID